MKPHLLVVEDDEIIQALLAAFLKKEDYRVSIAGSGGEMLALLDSEPIDLIVLDLGLPDEDGIVLARRVRARSSVPIIVLTARKGRDDRIASLEIGADDYITKPFDPEELLLRIRNVLARSGDQESDQQTSQPAALEMGDWKVDPRGRTVTASDGRRLEVSRSEFNLLMALAGAPDRVLSRAFLLDAVTGIDGEASDRMIDVLVSRLRKKLECNPKKPELIVTVTGFGYKYQRSGA